MLAEPVAHLHKGAEALSVGGVCERRARGEYPWHARITAAMAGRATARGPHCPIASADAELKVLGHKIRQREFGLHAAAGAGLREEGNRRPLRMGVEPAILALRQVGDIAVDPPTIPYRGDSRGADAK
jgi:hypothetical protein